MIFVLVISAILGAFRLFGEKGELLQAAAHFWVAWLLSAWWYTSDRRPLYVAVALSLLEVACFLGLHITFPF